MHVHGYNRGGPQHIRTFVTRVYASRASCINLNISYYMAYHNKKVQYDKHKYTTHYATKPIRYITTQIYYMVKLNIIVVFKNIVKFLVTMQIPIQRPPNTINFRTKP